MVSHPSVELAIITRLELWLKPLYVINSSRNH